MGAILALWAAAIAIAVAATVCVTGGLQLVPLVLLLMVTAFPAGALIGAVIVAGICKFIGL